MENDDYITDTMKRFKLVDMRERYPELIREAEQKQIGYKEFLINLLKAEDEGKSRRKRERLLDHAGFEYIKTLDQIDYSFNASLDPDKIRELGSLRFLDAGENVLIVGPPGVGKTMIATGIGIQACNAGRKVLFSNANDLMDHLTESMQNRTLKGNLRRTAEDTTADYRRTVLSENGQREKRAFSFRLSARDMKELPHYHHQPCRTAGGTKSLPVR